MNLDQIIAKRLAKSSLEENFCPSNLNNVLLTIVKEFTQGSKEFQELQAIRNLVNAIYFIQMDQRPDYLKKLDLLLISPLIDVIGNDLLLAALSHAKWLISKDHKSCEIAVEHYIKIVKIVEKNQIGESYLLNIKNYLFEASNLAKILKNGELKAEIKNLAEELLRKNLQKNECFFQLWMIEVVLSLDKNYGKNLIQILWEIIDLNINSKSNPKYIKCYYVPLIKILQQNYNIDEIRKAKIKIANYYIEYTNEVIQNNINKIRGNWALIDEFLVDAKEIYTEFNMQNHKKNCDSLRSQAQQL